ncbi:MAG: bifunctional hydroxymethylpyrimidine kinase/phosphomethylpyrimidine kinase [Gemmatimonadetes bacterium]|nr:bifunctional hydroxymethylpyrimidine kinase/phosphomethylpyrimidine kinase [Gemmatimonadota bacterium]
MPVALTIAGSDSAGGAGLQADLKTFHTFGVFGTTAVTAVTVQDTRGVHGVHPIPLEIVRHQIEVVVNDLSPSAVKTGMLATRELVTGVAEALAEHEIPAYVLDPVMVATSGDRLLDENAVGAIRERLLPLSTLVTPNTHEAELLTGRSVRSVADLGPAARALVDAGAAAALVKGGHLEGDEAIDLLWDGTTETVWRHRRLDTVHTHGTGCTLSAAAAAGLAAGRPLLDAVGDAIEFVARALGAAPELGHGHGPLNHFVSAR